MSLGIFARTAFALAGILAGLGLSACNTVEGFGKDLKRGGAALEESARSKK